MDYSTIAFNDKYFDLNIFLFLDISKSESSTDLNNDEIQLGVSNQRRSDEIIGDDFLRFIQ